MMTVRELISALQLLDPELPVLKSRDAEGNGYEFLYCVDDDSYVEKDTTYSCDAVYRLGDLSEFDLEVTDMMRVVVIV